MVEYVGQSGVGEVIPAGADDAIALRAVLRETPETRAEYTPLERRLLGAVESYKALCAAAGVRSCSGDAWNVFLATLVSEGGVGSPTPRGGTRRRRSASRGN